MSAPWGEGRDGIYADVLEIQGNRDVSLWGGRDGVHVPLYGGRVWGRSDSLWRRRAGMGGKEKDPGAGHLGRG